jgi:type IX secretion system PorP/SprF family membrane protein
MNKHLILIAILFINLCSFGQQDAIYSQYSFNPLVINPAYAGSRNSISAVLLHRSQWVGISDAPRTQTLAIHSPTNKSKLAFGFNMAYDVIGPVNNLNAGFSTAYHLEFKKSKLSLALRAGFYNTTLNKNKLTFLDNSDLFNEGGVVTTTVPSFDFGAYYYKTRFYLGLSINHLTQHGFKFYENVTLNTGELNYELKTHAFLSGGYVFDINKNLMFKPSFLLKGTRGAAANLDLSFNALFYKKIWLGISFRNKSSVNFMTEINITDYLRLGYAYDLSINKLSQFNNGSHEIFIGFDFNLKSKKIVSPRYL